MSRDSFKAFVGDSTFDTGGRLNPKQANTFVDYVVDQQVLLKMCTTVRMTRPKQNIDELSIGSRIIRAHVENTAPTGTGVTTAQRQLATTKIIASFEIDYEVNYDASIERGKFMDHIMKIAAKQIGNDFEDLAFVGDTTSADDFIKIENGWNKVLKSDANVYDHNGSTDYLNVIFPNMLKQLPVKYRRKGSLVFIMTPDEAEDYIDQLGSNVSDAAFAYITGERVPLYKGIKVIGAPFAVSGEHILTDPKNLLFGIDIKEITREFDKDIRKQVIYAVFTAKIDYQIANPDAAVISYNAP